MLWKLDGVALEDIVAVPKAQPGRHFSTGHHILGNLSSTLDAKYAQMTYGEHYRKKVEAALKLERQHCADLLAEQKKKALAQKVLTPPKKSPVSPQRKPRPRYDLNELRHHQRRCAALLFGARERGAHKLPVLVQWAPKRRESYYLMSERVYNDRVLMKMRADAGDSPLNFDFSNTDGETDDLHEFQKFVNKTSKDIKQLSFDTKYKDYTYDFGEDEEKRTQDEDTRTTEDGQTTDSNKGRRKVVFSDRVTESDTDAIDAKSLARSKRRQERRLIEGLDHNDIDLIFDSVDEIPDGEHQTGSKRVPGSEKSKMRHSKDLRKGLSSPDLLSLLHGTDEYSSDFTSEDDSDAKQPGDEGNQGLPSGLGEEYLQSQKDEKKLHRNKQCKHYIKQKTQEYYNKLPKLLKTAELRAKLPSKFRERRYDNLGMEANHQCMEKHKMAYDRALTVARFRSLPFSCSFLSRNINAMHSFSYFPGLPSSQKVTEKKDENSLNKKNLKEVSPGGRGAIFGELDMDDFYTQEDELIYFINPEELKNVVTPTTSGAENSRNEEDISSRSNTTYTSRSNTVKSSSEVESENEL